MPVNDQEPRYQLVSADGTDVIGSVYAESDGTLKLQEGSGSNNEAALAPDGTLSVPGVVTDEQTINEQAASIYQDNTQTISSDTVTTVQFDTEDPSFSSGDVLTVDLSNNKITIEKAGTYYLKSAVMYASIGDGTRYLCQVKQGAVNVQTTQLNSGGDDRATAFAIGVIQVSSPPIDITADTFQNSGINKDTQPGDNRINLQVVRLG